MSETNDMILNDKEERTMDLEMEKAVMAEESEAVPVQDAQEMEPDSPAVPAAEAATEPEETLETGEVTDAEPATEPKDAVEAEEAADVEPAAELVTESENADEVDEVADTEPASEPAAEPENASEVGEPDEPETMEEGPSLNDEPVAEAEAEADLQEEPESTAVVQNVIERDLGNAVSESERRRLNAERRREHARRMRLEAPLDEKGKPIVGSLSSFDPVLADISQKRASREILTGTIEEIKRGRDGGEGWVEALYQNYRVLIPFSEMDVELEHRHGESKQDYKARIERIIRNMMGARIDFIITGIDYDSNLIAGSRAMAARIRRKNILSARDREGNFLIYPGRRVSGNVLAVYQNVALIDVYGMLVRLKARDIRADYVVDVRDEIQNGMTIPLYITNLSRDENGNITSLYISMRDDKKEKEQIENQLEGMNPGDEFLGRVTGRSRNAIFITLNNGLQALAYISNGIRGRRIPNHGDRVAFRMIEIQTNKISGNPIVIGRIVRNINYDVR